MDRAGGDYRLMSGSPAIGAYAGFPRSDVVWQCGAYPGPARLEDGGLRGKVARKARG